MIYPENSQYTLYSDLNDKIKGAIHFHSLSDGKILAEPVDIKDKTYLITVKFLTPEEQKDIFDHGVGFLDSFRWKPLVLKKEGKVDLLVLMNINSAIKRLKLLGFKEESITNALEGNDFTKNIEMLIINKKHDQLLELLINIGGLGAIAKTNDGLKYLEKNLKTILNLLENQVIRKHLTIAEIKDIFSYSKRTSKEFIKKIIKSPEHCKYQDLKEEFYNIQYAYKIDQLLNNYHLNPAIQQKLAHFIINDDKISFTFLKDVLKNQIIVDVDDLKKIIDVQQKKLGQLLPFMTEAQVKEIWIWIQRSEIALAHIENCIAQHDSSNYPIRSINQFIELVKWDICKRVEQVIPEHLLKIAAQKAKDSQSGVQIKIKNDSDLSLSRSVQVDPQGNLYVLFNKVRLGDKVLGAGGFKTVKTSMDIKTGKTYARATQESTTDALVELHLSAALAKAAVKDDQKGILHTYELSIIETENLIGNKKLGFMQQLGNEDLLSALDNFSIKSLDEKFMIGKQILSAVDWLHHEQNLLHRDIKLENFLVVRNEKNEVTDILIGDFGLSCYQSDTKALSYFGGTPRYMSPELVKAIVSKRRDRIARANDYPSDNWSLGLTLFHLFKDHVPEWKKVKLPGSFKGPKVSTELKKGWLPIPSPESTASNPFITIIEGLLCLDPEKRMDTKEALSLLNN